MGTARLETGALPEMALTKPGIVRVSLLLRPYISTIQLPGSALTIRFGFRVGCTDDIIAALLGVTIDEYRLLLCNHNTEPVTVWLAAFSVQTQPY